MRAWCSNPNLFKTPKLFEKMIVFNQVLGLEDQHHRLRPNWCAEIQMKPELVGHFSYNRLHGGVISASLDALGGLAVMAAIGARHMDEAPMQRLHRFRQAGHHRPARRLPAPRHWRTILRCVHKPCAWVRAWPPPYGVPGADGKLLATGAGPACVCEVVL